MWRGTENIVDKTKKSVWYWYIADILVILDEQDICGDYSVGVV